MAFRSSVQPDPPALSVKAGVALERLPVWSPPSLGTRGPYICVMLACISRVLQMKGLCAALRCYQQQNWSVSVPEEPRVPVSESESVDRVRLFATPQTVTRQAPLSMKFSRQEYWSSLGLPHCRWILYCLSHQGSPCSSKPHPNSYFLGFLLCKPPFAFSCILLSS